MHVHFVKHCLFCIVFVFVISGYLCSPSKRAKCAVECYLKCVASGTPKAVYCNCPVKNESNCDSITDELIQSEMSPHVPQVETVYKDVRTVMVKLVNGIPSAFIYVFEYSAVSIDKEQWVFAGASSSPQITFTIPDSCRDYQFRVIVVLRSNNPVHQLMVFRPRAIPVDLPSFSVPQELIQLDAPRQSNDEQSLHVFVSWQNPRGYFDSDIYGYESPVAYPIRCMIPEDSLSQPRVEIVQDGAKMHLNLPIDVLEEKCRIFLEVRMIPRCVRLEPFDIQASIELNCLKFPMLNYCKKEMSPQCSDVVDIWGENGKANMVWQPPVHNRLPLFYQILHGLTQSHGAFPFVTRKILNSRETRVPGNQTKFEMLVQTGVQYGVQICAVFSARQTKNLFNLVPVIPFTCSPCANMTTGDTNCVQCAKIEDAENMVPVECLSQACATNNLTTHFISMNTAQINVNNSSKERHTVISSNSINPLQRHSKIISTENAIPVDQETPFHNDGSLDLLSLSTSTITPEMTPEETAETTEASVDSSTSTEAPTTSTTESTTTTSTETTTSATNPRETTADKDSENMGHVELMPVTVPGVEKETTTEIDRNDGAAGDDGSSAESAVNTERTTITPPKTKPTTVADEVGPVQSNRGKIEGIRLHPPKISKPCKQKNGIICEFGCLDDLRCDCPRLEKSCIRGIHCPFVKDLRAVYENNTRTLKLYSEQIANVLKNSSLYDKIYLEFGEIGPAESSADGLRALGLGNGEFVFKNGDKERAVISLEHINVTQLFDKIPYIMSVEKPLRVGDLNYGLSICALNSSLVPVIMDNVFMEQSLFNENSISSFTQTLLSPVELNEEARVNSDARKSLILVIAPILIVFATMIFVGALLCASVVRDRRQTPSEKFRRRGIFRDQSSTRFTGFRANLGATTIQPIPATSTASDQGRVYTTRNVRF